MEICGLLRKKNKFHIAIHHNTSLLSERNHETAVWVFSPCFSYVSWKYLWVLWLPQPSDLVRSQLVWLLHGLLGEKRFPSLQSWKSDFFFYIYEVSQSSRDIPHPPWRSLLCCKLLLGGVGLTHCCSEVVQQDRQTDRRPKLYYYCYYNYNYCQYCCQYSGIKPQHVFVTNKMCVKHRASKTVRCHKISGQICNLVCLIADQFLI